MQEAVYMCTVEGKGSSFAYGGAFSSFVQSFEWALTLAVPQELNHQSTST
jgi:hypothetical protein